MVHKSYSKKELSDLKGKNIQISSSDRINMRCRMFMDGMCFRVIDFIENTNELFIEPLPETFKDNLQLLPVSMLGIEWGISEVLS